MAVITIDFFQIKKDKEKDKERIKKNYKWDNKTFIDYDLMLRNQYSRCSTVFSRSGGDSTEVTNTVTLTY